jgi:hypothetical protein
MVIVNQRARKRGQAVSAPEKSRENHEDGDRAMYSIIDRFAGRRSGGGLGRRSNRG